MTRPQAELPVKLEIKSVGKDRVEVEMRDDSGNLLQSWVVAGKGDSLTVHNLSTRVFFTAI